MARMVHRHVMTGEEAGAARRRRPVGLAESMWPIGWLFGAAATAWLTVNLRGLLEPGALGGWLGLLGITISLVSIALWFVALARLLAGWVMGLEPRPAWALGAAAVALLLADRLAIDLWLALGISGDAPVLTTALAIASYVPWMALLLAFAMGLGRGTARRVAERRVVPQYELGTAGG